MANGIYVSADSARARLEQLETTSHNLANMITSGYRRRQTIFAEVQADVLRQSSPQQALGVHRPVRFLPEDRIGVETQERFVYWSQGNLDYTGNVLDLGVEGQGFLTIEGANGERLYTRNGSLQLNGLGELITQRGNKVLDRGGRPIRVPPGSGNLDVSYDGRISANGVFIGQLNFVTFGDGVPRTLNQSLEAMGESSYRLTDPNIAETPAQGVLRQGYIEGSNVNAVAEMTSLLSVSRLYELSSRAMQAYSDLDKKAAEDVGRLQ
jgi:flagellar basal body rod protein FlgG